MIIPLKDESLLVVFRCGVCGKTFIRGATNISCCVNHSGGCCHYTDRLISPETANELKKVISNGTDITNASA